ncbi:MAG: sodium:solute symporter family protein [Bacteroidetes bacterium]|nr:sodium:solute symporter family protein [Bacteroidota bacterium]
MLATGILLYCLLTLGLGLWAARRVKGIGDFLVAGRRLPLHITTAALFATWFGSETLLGASEAFAKEGLRGTIEDPIGAALCLILLGLFVARPLYGMGLYTFGDYYRVKYGPRAEWLGSILLVVSYLGWIAGQMLAIGIVAEIAMGIPKEWGIVLGSLLVMTYTRQGGMWSVSILDTVQNTVIIAGLLGLLWLAAQTYPLEQLTGHLPAEQLAFLPEKGTVSFWNWLALWIAVGWGSLPQQDVFQRVMSARSVRVAVWSSLLAGLLYLVLGFIPVVVSAAVLRYQPELVGADAQYALPAFVQAHAPFWLQLLFLGALLSAIMSTASGAILAPAAILSENLLKHLRPGWFSSPKKELAVTRGSVVGITLLCLAIGLLSESIHALVVESSVISLVSLFVPMVAVLWQPKGYEGAALASMICGLTAWLLASWAETALSPALWGLGASATGYIAGAVFLKYLSRKRPISS